MKNFTLDNKDIVVLFTTILLGLSLIALPLLSNSLTIYNAGYGWSWVSAFWSAYNGDVVSTLMSMAGSWLALATAAAIFFNFNSDGSFVSINKGVSYDY